MGSVIISDSIIEFKTRRQENKQGSLQKVLKDILDIWTVVDREKGGKLHVQFVAGNPHKLPTGNVDKFNFKYLVASLTKLQDQLDDQKLVLRDVNHSLANVISRSDKPSVSSSLVTSTGPGASIAAPPAVKPPVSTFAAATNQAPFYFAASTGLSPPVVIAPSVTPSVVASAVPSAATSAATSAVSSVAPSATPSVTTPTAVTSVASTVTKSGGTPFIFTSTATSLAIYCVICCTHCKRQQKGSVFSTELGDHSNSTVKTFAATATNLNVDKSKPWTVAGAFKKKTRGSPNP
jgi:hypothetical protein